jgi:hypothetical protein
MFYAVFYFFCFMYDDDDIIINKIVMVDLQLWEESQ